MNKCCSLEYAKNYVDDLIKNAVSNCRLPISIPTITWKPMGVHAAGSAVYNTHEIQLNTNYLTSADWELFINRTPIHELAHLIANKYFNDSGHGRAWKMVCGYLGLDPSRCHNYKKPKTQVGTRVRKYYSAHCDCRHYELSSIRYNRMMNDGQSYYCRLCKGSLKLD